MQPVPTASTLVDVIWHLVSINDDEVNIPQHRADLRFRSNEEELRAFFVNRITGEDLPMGSGELTGSKLEIRMSLQKETSHVTFLTLNWTGARFEGHYHSNGVPGPLLKLVRSTR